MTENEAFENLLNIIHHQYGYDFTQYSKASLLRRVNAFFTKTGLKSYDELSDRLNEEQYFLFFVQEVTVNVTEMFRDVSFYKMLRENIIPILATYPFVRIWHAGCSTGEEVYSVAILLREAGILQKSILYATDINQDVIESARKGIFSARMMQKYSENYMASGGPNDFSVYYRANYNLAKFDETLSKKMVFSTHNLVSDSSFNEFQLIICRNVLIYFNKGLQARVLDLFDKSLQPLGFLALGSKESLRFSDIDSKYGQINAPEKVWRKNQ